MRELIKNGSDSWPGAKYIKKENMTNNLKYSQDLEVNALKN